jgi:hypothetical protein
MGKTRSTRGTAHRCTHDGSRERFGQLDRNQGGPLDFPGHGHEKRRLDSGPRRLGISRRARQRSGIEVIATGETLKSGGEKTTYAATVYPGPKGNWVFNAATIYWSIGLSQPPGFVLPYSHSGRPHGTDERVQRITTNFLQKCGISPR